MSNTNISKTTLVLANIIPIYGVLFWKWSVGEIIYLYWLETVIIGLIIVFKIIIAQGISYRNSSIVTFVDNFGKSHSKVGTLTLVILLFITQYGTCVYIYHFFITNFLFKTEETQYASVLLIALPIFFSHTVSFFLNYVRGKEYEKVSRGDVFSQPYNRIFVMHITIIFSVVLLLLLEFQSNIILLLIFILIKTLADIHFHGKEHNSIRILEESTLLRQNMKHIPDSR